MTAAVIGVLLPVIAGWLSLLALRPRFTDDSTLVMLTVGGVCALGLSSVVTFWCAVFGVTIGARFAIVDALAWAAVGTIAWRSVRRGRRSRALQANVAAAGSISSRLTAADWLVRAAFAAIAAIALATAIAHNLASPHGEWDAWAIWNQKARFLARDINHWTAMMDIPWSNPTHPLFVSLAVARLWAYAGNETTFVPAMLGILWGVGIVAVVMGALDPRRRRAWIAGSVLVAPATFPQLASAQTADLAEGLFVVTALVMLRSVAIDPSADTADTQHRLLLAGAVGSVAAWTKNEGVLLVTVPTVIVAWMMLRRGRVRQVAWWVVGAVPVLFTLAWFKLVTAPSVALPYLPETAGVPSLTARLFDPARHLLVVRTTGQYWMKWGGRLTVGILPATFAAVVWAACRPAGRSARVLLMVVVLLLAAYEVVWVLSPIDTTWLIGTTFDRLLMQVWPALVLIAFAADDRVEKQSPA